METTAVSNSPSRLLVDYFRSRFPVWLIVALPLLVISPAYLVGTFASAVEMVQGLTLALLLVVEFRLWDDLCDREQDCSEDPSRALCQAESLQPFVVVLVILALASAGPTVWMRSWPGVMVFLLIHGALALWYAVRTVLSLGPVVNFHAVLLKYPAFGLILGMTPRGELSPALLPWLAVIYLGLCCYEVLHDPRLRSRRAAWIWLTIDSTLFVGIGIALALGKFS